MYPLKRTGYGYFTQSCGIHVYPILNDVNLSKCYSMWRIVKRLARLSASKNVAPILAITAIVLRRARSHGLHGVGSDHLGKSYARPPRHTGRMASAISCVAYPLRP